MCETAELVDNIEDICAVDGLDSLCIGAMDLSGSLGVPYGTLREHYRVVALCCLVLTIPVESVHIVGVLFTPREMLPLFRCVFSTVLRQL